MTPPHFPCAKQIRREDCGVAALQMIAMYHGLDVSYSRLRKLMTDGRRGISLLTLIQAAERIGLQAEGNKLRRDSLTMISDMLPAIAHVAELGYHHYVVLYQIKTDNTVVLGDPTHRRLVTVSKHDFLNRWTGILVVFRKIDHPVRSNSAEVDRKNNHRPGTRDIEK